MRIFDHDLSDLQMTYVQNHMHGGIRLYSLRQYGTYNLCMTYECLPNLRNLLRKKMTPEQWSNHKLEETFDIGEKSTVDHKNCWNGTGPLLT